MPGARRWTAASVLAVASLCVGSAAAQDAAQPPAQPLPVVRSIHITGAKELSEDFARRALAVEVGQPLPDTPEKLAAKLTRRYENEGYSFAHVTAELDEAAGAF